MQNPDENIDDIIDALAADAVRAIPQPRRCEVMIRALANLAKGLPPSVELPRPLEARVAELEARVAELEGTLRDCDAEIRQLKTGRFAPAERAVLEACSEMMVQVVDGRVRVPLERDVELVAEAEWAKRQEHKVADFDISDEDSAG